MKQGGRNLTDPQGYSDPVSAGPRLRGIGKETENTRLVCKTVEARLVEGV
jgi:hypothetical protein